MPELTPKLDLNNEMPLYIQLYEYIKSEIKKGKLQPNMKLPSKRKLSRYLGISQNTIENAYSQLIAEGYIEALSRKGYFVCNIEQELIFQEKQLNKDIPEKLFYDPTYHFDFSHTGVDSGAFPYAVFRKLTNEVIRPENEQILRIGHPQGEFKLRETIAKYLFHSRGVYCSPSQIVIGAGSHYLYRLLFQLLAGSRFAVEDPGYQRRFVIFEKGEENVEMIPLDKEGIMVSHLEKTTANAVFVTPSHHFPCGLVMPISRRMQLLKWAEEREDRFIIEDDYDSEFRYSGKPIPALQGMDRDGKVIYMGTFSKALIPSLRISYLVLPMLLIKKYQEEFFIYSQTVSRIDQEILAKFIVEGYWEKHINKMRVVYHRKRNELVAAISSFFPNSAEIIGQDSGLHVLVRVHNGMNEQELVAEALKYNIKVYPVSAYGKSDNKTILLGFGIMPEEEISQGIQLLSKAWL
ncbi:PLP-dependent aminotransferase family protein [Bacillus sp. S/N-304-OC-R1]|uniref:MocR-like pyridoxine biosynthesis transcription factor PdxR n=1 Tax=Bacillus sp. S/N-304-OC-R1 TaxID=2758034 RepID=UPI001C8EBFD9|nr:PLP-dependent aminotransferase family protein [Bacillus sp. S/N-304-OC-R1]MBY0121843.1 PLP-dependent aminotransferase family protein [Bacillus sp. S/N-304-OC-R1]